MRRNSSADTLSFIPFSSTKIEQAARLETPAEEFFYLIHGSGSHALFNTARRSGLFCVEQEKRTFDQKRVVPVELEQVVETLDIKIFYLGLKKTSLRLFWFMSLKLPLP